MIRSRSSKETSPLVELGQPAQRAEAGGGDAAVLEGAGLGEVLALEVGEAEGLAALEGGVVADLGRDEQRALHLGDAQDAGEVFDGELGDVDADDRAERHELLDVGGHLALPLVERDRVAAARQLLQDREQVLAGVVGLDLQHGAVGAHGRRADLDQEVAGDRDPRGVAAGERLQADVAEGLDEQGGGGLRVHRRGRRGRSTRRSAARSRRRRCARRRSDDGRPLLPGGRSVQKRRLARGWPQATRSAD